MADGFGPREIPQSSRVLSSVSGTTIWESTLSNNILDFGEFGAFDLDAWDRDCLTCRVLNELPLEQLLPWEDIINKAVTQHFRVWATYPLLIPNCYLKAQCESVADTFVLAHATCMAILDDHPEVKQACEILLILKYKHPGGYQIALRNFIRMNNR